MDTYRRTRYLPRFLSQLRLALSRRPMSSLPKLVEVFLEVRRVLRDDGTLWLNLGDASCWKDAEKQQHTSKTNAGGLRLQSIDL